MNLLRQSSWWRGLPWGVPKLATCQHANHQLTLWSGWTMASCSCLNWHTLSKTSSQLAPENTWKTWTCAICGFYVVVLVSRTESMPKPLHIWVHPIWEEFLHFESFQSSDQVWRGLVAMIVPPSQLRSHHFPRDTWEPPPERVAEVWTVQACGVPWWCSLDMESIHHGNGWSVKLLPLVCLI